MAARRHTDEELLEHIGVLRTYGNEFAAARATGVSRGTLCHRTNAVRMRWPDCLPPADPRNPNWGKAARKPRIRVAAEAAVTEPSLDERLETTALKAHASDLKRRLAEAENALRHDRATIRAALGLRDADIPTIKWPPNAHVPDTPGVPIFMWSDWHIGETVDPGQMYGINAYNEVVCRDRVSRLVERSIYLCTSHIAKLDTRFAVLILGGDFVSGWLHEELIATDWCTPMQAVHEASGLLIAGIKRLRQVFDRLMIVAVPGNHGRLMKRPPAKGGAYQSFDWLIYGWLQRELSGDTGVELVAPAEGDYILQVHETRYFIAHGHELGVKGGDGLIGSIGPIMRGRQKIGRANASMGRDFDILVLAHFHQSWWLPSQGVIVNNCLIGYNEYARQQKYVAAPPSQMLWFTHPRFGAVCPIEVFTEDET